MPQISVKISQEAREVWPPYTITRQTLSFMHCQILLTSGLVDLDLRDPTNGNGLMEPTGIMKAGGQKMDIPRPITQDLII